MEKSPGELLQWPVQIKLVLFNAPYLNGASLSVAAVGAAYACEGNGLPLTLVLSRYEQRAVCILLTLLYLGIQNIHIGPALPAFVSPDVLHLLAEKFHLPPCGEAERWGWNQNACKIRP